MKLEKLTEGERDALQPGSVVYVRYTTRAHGLYPARILAIARTRLLIEHGQRTSRKRVERWVSKSDLYSAPATAPEAR